MKAERARCSGRIFSLLIACLRPDERVAVESIAQQLSKQPVQLGPSGLGQVVPLNAVPHPHQRQLTSPKGLPHAAPPLGALKPPRACSHCSTGRLPPPAAAQPPRAPRRTLRARRRAPSSHSGPPRSSTPERASTSRRGPGRRRSPLLRGGGGRFSPSATARTVDASDSE